MIERRQGLAPLSIRMGFCIVGFSILVAGLWPVAGVAGLAYAAILLTPFALYVALNQSKLGSIFGGSIMILATGLTLLWLHWIAIDDGLEFLWLPVNEMLGVVAAAIAELLLRSWD